MTVLSRPVLDAMREWAGMTHGESNQAVLRWIDRWYRGGKYDGGGVSAFLAEHGGG